MQVQVPVVQTMGNITSAQRGFSIKSGSFAFDLLSSGMYTRPIEAVIREVICNAIDAHADAGNTSPVKVQLPNDEHSDFVVEDEGTGMAFDVLERLMTTYFDSTKRDTNDQIGGFGIGSKAPFAYTDTFNIRARWNGVQRFYVAYKETDGPVLRQIGDDVHTTERNGIRVSFPVRDADFVKFEDAFAKVALYLPKGSVVSGFPITHYSDCLYEVVPGVWRKREDMPSHAEGVWHENFYYPNGSSLTVCMGGVHYSVETSVALRAHRLGIRLITVPVGALTPHPSREILTPDADSETLLTTFVDDAQTVLTANLVEIMENKSASLFAKQVANKEYSSYVGNSFIASHIVSSKATETVDSASSATWDIVRYSTLMFPNKKGEDWVQRNTIDNLPSHSTVVVSGNRTINSKVLEFNNLTNGLIFYIQKKNPEYVPPNFDNRASEKSSRFLPWNNNKERDEAVEEAITFLNEQFSLNEDDNKARNYHSLPKVPRVKVGGEGSNYVPVRRPVMAKDLMNGQADVEVPDDVPCLYVITVNTKPQCDVCCDTQNISYLLQEDIVRNHLTKLYGTNVMVVLLPTSIHKKFLKRSGKSVPLKDYMQLLVTKEAANIKDCLSRSVERSLMTKQELPSIIEKFLERKDNTLLDIELANPHINVDEDYSRFAKTIRSALLPTPIWKLPTSSSTRSVASMKCVKKWEKLHAWWEEKAGYLGDIHVPVVYSHMAATVWEHRNKQAAFLQSAIDVELEKLYVEFKSQ